MNPNKKSRQVQPHLMRKRIKRTDSYDFFNILTSRDLLEVVEGLLPEHRERVFSPTETLSMLLAQAMSADHSCRNIISQSAVARVAEGLRISTNTGAYCKARQRLPLEMISELVRFTGKMSSDQALESWKWRGRRVKLIDGTTTTMPDTPENQKAFPQPTTQEPGLGFPICRIVGITCLSSETILDSAIGPYSGKGTGEQSLLRQLIDNFEVGNIVIGDAYYSSYFLLAELMARGVDCVFEQHGQRKKSTDFRRGQKLGKKDHLITYASRRKSLSGCRNSSTERLRTPSRFGRSRQATKFWLRLFCRARMCRNRKSRSYTKVDGMLSLISGI